MQITLVNTAISGLLILAIGAGCTPADTPPPREDDPQYIVDKAIEAHGSKVLDNAVIEFDYRDKHFIAYRHNGVFSYERIYEDSLGSIREIYNNDEAFMEIDGVRVDTSEKKIYSIQETNNSVVYFGFVPYFLNDGAVVKKYLGKTTINDEAYHEIQITFRQENGGPDYEDRFIYWFHADNYTMDYLAYDFHINDGGTRFREAYNIRTIEGLRVLDFKNYTSEEFPQPGTAIEAYESLLGTDRLELLSEINLENVKIRLLEE